MSKSKRAKSVALLLALAFVFTSLFSGIGSVAFAASDTGTRLYGSDRYATAVEISKDGWDSSANVVLVSGQSFADALAAGPLAKKLNAPILLTMKDTLPQVTQDEINRLDATKVYIVGGTGVVSDAVATATGKTVERIAGADRYATAVAVAEEIGATADKVILARGDDYADALAAAAVQGSTPILFAGKAGATSLQAATEDAITDLSVKDVVIVGDTGVVSSAIETQVKSLVSGTVTRLAGSDRFKTAVAIANAFKPEGGYQGVVLATGYGYADALAAGPYAAKNNYALLLSGKAANPLDGSAINFIQANDSIVADNIIAVGGVAVVPDAAVSAAKNAATKEATEPKTLNVTLLNPVEGYSDVVLNGTLAQVAVKALDANGNPVAGVPIVFEEEKIAGDDESTAWFQDSVAYTDADGIAIGFATAYNEGENGYYKKDVTDSPITLTYKVSVSGKNITPVEGKIRFAQMSVGTVSVIKPTDADGNVELNPSDNAPANTYTTPITTHDMNGNPTEYVASQKVSPAGTAKNAVTFQVKPQLSFFAEDQTAGTDTYSASINWKSGSYHPYDEIKSDKISIPAGLKYASIYLKNLQLDDKAVMYVNFYEADGDAIGDSTVTVTGPVNDTSRIVQIPANVVNVAGAYFQVVIKTAGQVNTAYNGGVEIDKVEGVFQTDDVVKTTDVALANAKITWTLEDQGYSETKTLAKNSSNSYDYALPSTIGGVNVARYDYKVPAFPRTGDAVVTAYDANGKVLAYYLLPTVNKVDNNKYTNVNVLKSDAKAILASADEVNRKVGTVTANADGTEVTVNSEATGVSLLKGVISIPGVSNDVLNATNATVYTSVNWAPLVATTVTSTKLFALKGQTVTLTAQLVDANGNMATEAGQTVSLTSGDNSIALPGNKTTDANGQAKFVLSASDTAYIYDLKAVNTSGKYNVVLKVGSQNVSLADIYWVDANISHKAVIGGTEYTSSNTPADPFTYNAGDSIEFGFQVKGIVGQNLRVNGVQLSNVPMTFTKETGSVGSVAPVSGKPSVFLAASEKAGTERVDVAIGTITDATGVAVKYTTDGTNYVDGLFVGTGASTIDDTFVTPIQWQAQGAAFDFVAPQGNKADINSYSSSDPYKLYIKVTDKFGNPLKDQAITVNGDTASSVATDSNGIATVEVTPATTTVSATYNGETKYYSIRWVNAAEDFQMVTAARTDTSVVVAFSAPVNANSIKPDQFVVTKDGATNYYPSSVTVDGNKVTLNFSSSVFNGVVATDKFTVEYQGSCTIGGIDYYVVDTNGKILAENDSIAFAAVPSAVPSIQSASVSGDTLTVTFSGDVSNAVDATNGLGLKLFVVDGKGKVIPGVFTGSNYDSDTRTLTVTVTADSAPFTVYFNGQEKAAQ
jgi:putative cell wall-binding protein